MLPQIRLHDLRHTHATLALQAGIHPKVVSERLGHATVSITLDTLRSAGRAPSTPEALELFAASLASDDEVALETTGNALAVARLLAPHVARVVVASARELHAISGAKAKTDRRDAARLRGCLAAGMFAGTWLPGEQARARRRRLAPSARSSCASAARLKNEVQATLVPQPRRRAVGDERPLRRRRRRWLDELELPADERETVAGCLRVLDFLGGEVESLERGIARHGARLARDPPPGDDPRRRRRSAPPRCWR